MTLLIVHPSEGLRERVPEAVARRGGEAVDGREEEEEIVLVFEAHHVEPTDRQALTLQIGREISEEEHRGRRVMLSLCMR